MKPLRIAVLVKQVPKFEKMQLGPDGRLLREGVELSLNPYCQRAVSKGVELAKVSGGVCTVLSLGPPVAEDVIRWGIAWGAENGILISDPLFAGSDTLATARALAAALTKEGPFDLILVGKNSVDADTGQVGPEVAQILGYPFACAVRTLEVCENFLKLGCEHDDSWVDVEVTLPVVISTAERLCDPAKVSPEARAEVDGSKVRVLKAQDLGKVALGSWGEAGSPTWVGETKSLGVERTNVMLEGGLQRQAAEAVSLINLRGALRRSENSGENNVVGDAITDASRTIVVVMEPGRPGSSRELLGAGARMARTIGGRVVGVEVGDTDLQPSSDLYSWGAGEVIRLEGSGVEEDVAWALASYCEELCPWCVLAPSTSWGREVASRVAAALGAGLTGDAVRLEVEADKLVSWKPAFGGSLVAAIRTKSKIQMATVRPGVLPRLIPRAKRVPRTETIEVENRSRLRVVSRRQDDELDALALANRVVGIGQGVRPDCYEELEPLLQVLGAELAVTRKVTDKGWMPHARQVGITGRTISPNLYIALAVGGKFNHSCGIQSSGTILAINVDKDAPIFRFSDIGIVADWRECVPLLVEEFKRIAE